MSMKYMSMVLGPVMTNCYIVYDSETKDAMVIDPAWDYQKIDQALQQHQLQLKLIFLTHGHADHIGALQELRNYKQVPVYVGKGDKESVIPGIIYLYSWEKKLNVNLQIMWYQMVK